MSRTHSTILERPDTQTVGYRIRRKDGSYTWFETTSRTVRDPETDEVLEIIAVSRDVTERKRVEAKLREAETRYRTLVEQIPAITYVAALDEVSSTIYVSPQAENMLGAAPEEWLADPELFVKLLHPEDREHVLSEHVRANRTGAPLKLEYRLTTWAGRVVWVRDESAVVRDGAGRPLFRQGVLLDITDRKEAEEQVLFQAHLLEQVQAAVIATDHARQGDPLERVRRERLYGWSREEPWAATSESSPSAPTSPGRQGDTAEDPCRGDVGGRVRREAQGRLAVPGPRHRLPDPGRRGTRGRDRGLQQRPRPPEEPPREGGGGLGGSLGGRPGAARPPAPPPGPA